MSIQHEDEVVEDIVSEAVSRMERRLGSRTLDIDLPEELLVIPMDGQLIIQVLVNLMENSMKHTAQAVSYTHLDVYKRQAGDWLRKIRCEPGRQFMR